MSSVSWNQYLNISLKDFWKHVLWSYWVSPVMLFFTFIHRGLWNAVHKINVREERCFAQFILNFFFYLFRCDSFATLFVSSFARVLNQLHSGSPNSSCSSARLFGFACDILFSPLKVDSSPHPTALVVVLLAIKGLAIQRSTKKTELKLSCSEQ